MKRVLIILATTLALVATSPVGSVAPQPQCNLRTGTYTVSGTCGWSGTQTLEPNSADLCFLFLKGAVQTQGMHQGELDAGVFSFEDSRAQTDAGIRVCTATDHDGGYVIACERCDTTCVPDCTATFAP